MKKYYFPYKSKKDLIELKEKYHCINCMYDDYKIIDEINYLRSSYVLTYNATTTYFIRKEQIL